MRWAWRTLGLAGMAAVAGLGLWVCGLGIVEGGRGPGVLAWLSPFAAAVVSAGGWLSANSDSALVLGGLLALLLPFLFGQAPAVWGSRTWFPPVALAGAASLHSSILGGWHRPLLVAAVVSGAVLAIVLRNKLPPEDPEDSLSVDAFTGLLALFLVSLVLYAWHVDLKPTSTGQHMTDTYDIVRDMFERQSRGQGHFSSWKSAFAFLRNQHTPFADLAYFGWSAFFGMTVTSLLISNAFLGALCAFPMFFVFRRFLRRNGLALALTAVFLFSPYTFDFARYSFTTLHLLCPVHFGLTLLCLESALVRRRLWAFLATGVLAGLSLYLYEANYVVLPLALVSLVWAAPGRAALQWRYLVGAALCVALSLTIAAPRLAREDIVHIDWKALASGSPEVRVQGFQRMPLGETLSRNFDQVDNLLFKFCPGHWYTRRAGMLLAPVTMLGIAGIGVHIAEFLNPMARVFLLAIPLSILPGALAPETASRRFMLLSPLLHLLMGMLILRAFPRRPEEESVRETLRGMLVMGGTFALCLTGVSEYFTNVETPEAEVHAIAQVCNPIRHALSRTLPDGSPAPEVECWIYPKNIFYEKNLRFYLEGIEPRNPGEPLYRTGGLADYRWLFLTPPRPGTKRLYCSDAEGMFPLVAAIHRSIFRNEAAMSGAIKEYRGRERYLLFEQTEGDTRVLYGASFEEDYRSRAISLSGGLFVPGDGIWTLGEIGSAVTSLDLGGGQLSKREKSGLLVQGVHPFSATVTRRFRPEEPFATLTGPGGEKLAITAAGLLKPDVCANPWLIAHKGVLAPSYALTSPHLPNETPQEIFFAVEEVAKLRDGLAFLTMRDGVIFQADYLLRSFRPFAATENGKPLPHFDDMAPWKGGLMAVSQEWVVEIDAGGAVVKGEPARPGYCPRVATWNDQRIALVSANSGDIELRDVATSQTRSWTLPLGEVRVTPIIADIDFLPDGRLAVLEPSGRLTIFDASGKESQTEYLQADAFGGNPSRMRIQADGEVLVTDPLGGRVWGFQAGRPFQRLATADGRPVFGLPAMEAKPRTVFRMGEDVLLTLDQPYNPPGGSGGAMFLLKSK